MAVNTNQSYTETLREMRATRTQQLRQGGAQAQLMNRQLATMSAMNNLISKQIQYISRLDGNQKIANRQLGDVNKNLNSLSSTFTKSFSNFANSMAKGAGRSVMAVGGAAASATGSIATSIASGIGNVLPAAIATYVAKSVVWDNMSQATRNRISGSMGSLFNKAFKEIDSTELGHALTKALSPAFQQIKTLAGKAGEKVEAVKQSAPSASEAVNAVANKANDVKEGVKATADELTFYKNVGSRAIKELGSTDLPDVGLQEVALGTASLGAGKLVYDANKNKKGKKLPDPKASMDDSIKKRIEAVNERKLKRREFVKANKLPGTKLDLLSGGVFRRIAGSSGKFVANFLKSFNELKLGKSLWVLGVAMEVGMTKLVEVEIDQMLEDEEITADEAQALRKWVTAQMWGSLIGGAVLGTLSGIGGTLLAGLTGGTGAIVIPAAVVTGSVVGSKKGQDFATMLVDLPKSLTEPMSGNKPGGAHSAMSERRDQNRKNGKPNATASEKPQANMSPILRPNLDDLPIEQVMGQYRDIVGQKEGGAAGYDAMNGVLKESDVQKYKEKETGGKRLTEMTIDEIIALQAKRKKSNTHAMGKYQFIDVTEVAGLAGLKGTDVFSPANQDKMFDAYTKENAKKLKKLKLPVNAMTLRLAHAVGPGGVKKLLEANETNPNALPADVLGYAEGSAARKTNPQLSKEGVTVASYLSSISKEVGGISGAQTASVPAAAAAKPEAGTATPTAQDKPSFNQKLASMFSGGMKFEDIIGGGYKNLTEELQTGYENIKGAEMKSKQSTNIVNGGSTTVVNNVQNSSSPFGGSGVSAEGYTSQFNSLAGFRVA